MYGVCAGLWLKKKNSLALLIAGLIFMGSGPLFAQTKPAKPNMGRVISDGAYVYKQADFDAEVLTQLPEGKTYQISSKVTGAFYKIKVSDGVYGYIADTDVKATSAEIEKKEKKEKEKKQADKEHRRRRHQEFDEEKFRGFQISQIGYREDTMGVKPTENLLFFGAKFTGPEVFMDAAYTDANILFSYGAPRYYEDNTGNSASGYILIGDFLFETPIPQSRDTMMYFGFGPMLKYSKFTASVTNNGKTDSYDMTDVSIGAVFNVGYAWRFDLMALRGELTYYWEKMQYLGFTLAVQVPF